MTYVDGRKNSGSARWRLKAKDEAQIIFYDDKRDLYTRFDLVARKEFQRRGAAGPWSSVGDILTTDCR